MKKINLLTASIALLAGCSPNTADDTTPTGNVESEGGMASENVAAQPATGDMAATDSMAVPTDAAGYAAMAGASDMFEIESSKAAMAKSNNADLDKFAQMMIDNHTQSTAKLTAAAKAANITMAPPMLNQMQQRMLDDIKNADAASVDRIYWQHQKAAHDMALKLHQGYASNGDNAELKKVAGEIVPVIEKHIAELGRMNAA